jgi:SAM-dependent methyltransferase
MTDAQQDASAAGQAVYSPLVLSVYDILVLGISNRFLWRCPTPGLVDLYNRNLGARHLDIGVGTGYFLDHAKWPVAKPDITLLDLNSNSLAAAARRIARYEPKSVVADVLKPLPPETGATPFQSVGLSYLFHCLPGAIPEKAVVFDHIRPFIASGSRVFGSTIVQGNVPRSGPAQKLMDVYNSKGIFSNSKDTVEDLESELRRRFPKVTVNLKGSVAVFEAEVA